MRSVKGLVLGAATAYFLDPQTGKRRRHVVQARTAKLARRLSSLARKKARYGLGKAHGLWATGRGALVRRQVDVADDVVEQRIRSEVFRDVAVSPSTVEIDVAHGVVTLTGSVGGDKLASDLVERIRKVPGVEDVAAMLHVVDEPVAQS